MQAEKEGINLCENTAGANFKFQVKNKIEIVILNYDSKSF